MNFKLKSLKTRPRLNNTLVAVLQPVAVTAGDFPLCRLHVHDGLEDRPAHLPDHHPPLLLHLLQETR